MGIEAVRKLPMRGVSLVLSLLAALLLLAPIQAAAQTSPAPNPSSVDARGVDLLDGDLILGAVDLAIGPSDHRGLTFGRQWTGGGWRIAGLPTLSGSTGSPFYSVGGVTTPFVTSGSTYVPVIENGTSLTGDRRDRVPRRDNQNLHL